MVTATTTHSSLSDQEIRLEALRLAMIQAPGARPATWTVDEALARARAFERYIIQGTTA